MNKQANKEDVLNNEVRMLSLGVTPSQLIEAIIEMLSPDKNPDVNFERTVAFISALEKRFHDFDLTQVLANHFIREVRKCYEGDKEPFSFEEVFAEALQDA